MSDASLSVVIAGKAMLTPSICRFELVSPDGGLLPPFCVGAHVNVTNPSGIVRSYSLTDSPRDRSRYVIAVACRPDGRGGSRSLVQQTAVGDHLRISEPVNGFPLTSAPDHLLIAGGIGITPMRAMLHELLARGHRRVRLIYLTRSAEETAYLAELGDPALKDHVVIHHSAEFGRLDLWPYLAEPGGTHVHCCGPKALMDEVRALTMHWNPRACHFEDFAGVSTGEVSTPFTAVWQPTGESVEVGSNDTLLDALRRRGIRLESSCESGTCGTCRIRLVSGEPDHRDLVLTEGERDRFLMPCVSRALSPDLTLAP